MEGLLLLTSIQPIVELEKIKCLLVNILKWYFILRWRASIRPDAWKKTCRFNICFMYFLERRAAPDHLTFDCFVCLHFVFCAKRILACMCQQLFSLGEIGGEHLFVDGMNIESRAGRYIFVWKKDVTKRLQKLMDKVAEFVADLETQYDLHLVHDKKGIKETA